MPSTLIGAQSGGVSLVSGNFFGTTPWPIAGVQLKAGKANSGNIYVALSGGVTVLSGGGLASGGMLDGMELAPGEPYFIPKSFVSGSFGFYSGQPGVFIGCAAAVSGFCRVFWEADCRINN